MADPLINLEYCQSVLQYRLLDPASIPICVLVDCVGEGVQVLVAPDTSAYPFATMFWTQLVEYASRSTGAKQCISNPSRTKGASSVIAWIPVLRESSIKQIIALVSFIPFTGNIERSMVGAASVSITDLSNIPCSVKSGSCMSILLLTLTPQPVICQ